MHPCHEVLGSSAAGPIWSPCSEHILVFRSSSLHVYCVTTIYSTQQVHYCQYARREGGLLDHVTRPLDHVIIPSVAPTLLALVKLPAQRFCPTQFTSPSPLAPLFSHLTNLSCLHHITLSLFATLAGHAHALSTNKLTLLTLVALVFTEVCS